MGKLIEEMVLNRPEGVEAHFLGKHHLFHDLVAGMDAVLPPSLPLPRFLRRDRARRRMHAMLRRVIAERRGASGQPQDFLQTLVEARDAEGRPLTDALSGQLHYLAPVCRP